MDFVKEWQAPGGLMETFFCRICKRRMVYWTRPNWNTKKALAEIAATGGVMDEAFNERRNARAAQIFGTKKPA